MRSSTFRAMSNSGFRLPSLLSEMSLRESDARGRLGQTLGPAWGGTGLVTPSPCTVPRCQDRQQLFGAGDCNPDYPPAVLVEDTPDFKCHAAL